MSDLIRENNDLAYEKTQLLLKYDKLEKIFNIEKETNERKIKDLEQELYRGTESKDRLIRELQDEN